MTENKKYYALIFLSLVYFIGSCPGLYAQENQPANPAEEISTAVAESPVSDDKEPSSKLADGQIASEELIRQAWEASSQRDMERLDSIIDQCLLWYGDAANKQQASLTEFPQRGKTKDYQALNDVGTCLFIQAEAVMNGGKKEEAIQLFQHIIDTYSWAQAWDPRGWFWSVKEKSQASIDVLLGKVEEPEQVKKTIKTIPHLHTPGTQKVVDYTDFGEFTSVGTNDFQYVINDPKGLSDAVGEGIYPNTGAVIKDPRYKELRDAGRLEGGHWDYVHTDDLEAAFYKWATATEPWGVKMFYLARIFEKAGMYYEAIKAYHSIVVHFPKTVAWTYWQTPWYPAQVAIAKINHLLRIHPDLNLKKKWMKIEVKNGFDNDIGNDIFHTFPGKIEKRTFMDLVREKINHVLTRLGIRKTEVKLGKITKKLGTGLVRLVQYENGHWQLLVKNKPYVIKGITYDPTKVGESPDKGTLTDWMVQDGNGNGLADGPYDTWVDANKNNEQDEDEPVVGDFFLMKEMGVNTLRFYHQPHHPNKGLLRKMYNQYGFRVILGDFLGKYTLGSGASWFEGTDYENPVHQKNMMDSVRKMVMEFKDEPYILMWLLGNENNYGVACNADTKPAAYFKFVNEVAKMIKSIDPDHPVAVCNGDTLALDKFAEFAPDVDIFAANVYRGDYGFGSFWEQVFDASGKAAFITEYGCPSFAKHLTLEEGEEAQANYHLGNWMDIQANMVGRKNGIGNALGGVTFEWVDEWWKNYEPFYHDRKSDAIGPFPGGYYFEEWFGLTGQGNGQKSPYLRQLKKSYFTYKEMWSKI